MTRNGSREVALWAGASAFFGNLIGLKVLELVSDQTPIQLAAAVAVSGAVGGAVYSRERLQAARERRRGA
jgi:membrane associated rhomboid family serine protease